MSAALKHDAAAKERFLELLEETCSVKDAAAAAGVHLSMVYHRKKQDIEFSRKWDAAVERGLDDLLGVAHKRAVAKKSDRLLEMLLKFRYGDRMADRLSVKVEASTGLNPDVLLLMAPQDRMALINLLSKYLDAELRFAQP